MESTLVNSESTRVNSNIRPWSSYVHIHKPEWRSADKISCISICPISEGFFWASNISLNMIYFSTHLKIFWVLALVKKFKRNRISSNFTIFQRFTNIKPPSAKCTFIVVNLNEGPWVKCLVFRSIQIWKASFGQRKFL